MARSPEAGQSHIGVCSLDGYHFVNDIHAWFEISSVCRSASGRTRTIHAITMGFDFESVPRGELPDVVTGGSHRDAFAPVVTGKRPLVTQFLRSQTSELCFGCEHEIVDCGDSLLSELCAEIRADILWLRRTRRATIAAQTRLRTDNVQTTPPPRRARYLSPSSSSSSMRR
jgi:hypothetical protein